MNSPRAEIERVIARLRLGAGFGLRHADDFKTIVQVERERRRDGFAVVFFENQQDVEFVFRIVERAHRLDERRQHIRLAIKRHQNRIERKIGLRGCLCDRLLARANPHQQRAEDSVCEITGHAKQGQARADNDRRNEKQNRDDERNGEQNRALPARDRALSGKFGSRIFQRANAAFEEQLARAPPMAPSPLMSHRTPQFNAFGGRAVQYAHSGIRMPPRNYS